jgi:hypothetical protein
MRNRRKTLAALCLCASLCGALAAKAQMLSTLFPDGVPGYGNGQGVTVRSRLHPELEPLGFRAGTVMVHPLFGSSFGYDDNIFGGSARRGAWEVAAQPSVLMSTQNPGGSAGLYLSADDVHYLGAASQNHTDGAAFLGGTIAIGRDKLTLSGGYLAQHESRTALDALPSDRPVAFTVENLRASYAAEFGRFTATPTIDLNRWRFDNTTIFGVPSSQAPRDRTTVQPGMTLRYAWMPGRDLLAVTRVLGTHYDAPAVGAPSNNSTSWQTLLGIDYDDNSVWRYRLLGGVVYRKAESVAIASQTTGIAEADITWSPTGMTTVRATAARGIEDAAQNGLSNFTYTSARLTVDHELFRNVLLNASATVRHATYNQTGGQQFGLAFGTGATWLINRNLGLSLTYDFSDVRNSHLPAGTVAGNYTRGLSLLTLRVGL